MNAYWNGLPKEHRILLTHDRRTIPSFAYKRLERGEELAGVFIVPSNLSENEAIQDLVLLVEASTQEEWEGHVLDLPLQ